MRFKRTRIYTAATLALGGAMGLSALPAFGQAAPAPAAAASAASESITVTGSRLRRIDAEGAAPIQTIDRSQIESAGIATIGELLQELPSIAGAATNPQVNNGGGTGAATISLRGLGSERTLILLDGRRLGPAFDVNSIPINLIDRVDILKQGAGATYGSDAIGGVVNFITRKDVNGVNLAYQYGRSSKNDAKTHNVEASFGVSNDKGHVSVGLNYNKTGAVSAGDRKFSKDALYWYTYNGALGVIPLGSSSTPQGRITLPGTTVLPNGNTFAEQYGGCGSVTRKTGAAGTSLDDFRCYTSADSYNYQPLNLDLTPQERSSIFLDAAYSVNDAVEVYASALHNETSSGFVIAALPMVADNDGWHTSANNPFGVMIGSGDGTTGNIQLRPTDLGTRHSDVQTTLNQFTGGVRGAIPTTSWTWDASYTYQSIRQYSNVTGYINGGLLQNALDSDAFNIFNVTNDNATGQASLVGLSPFSVGYTDTSITVEKTFEAAFTGDVFTWSQGTAKAAVGASYRKSRLGNTIDELTLYQPPDYGACLLAAETCSGPTEGSERVSELYGELFIPLLTDFPGVKALNLTLGTRYSRYDSFGSTVNSSVKLEYRPVTDLLIRATWGQVFRAPTIGDRFAAQAGGFPTFSDPCNNAGSGNSGTLSGNEANYDKVCQYITPDGTYTQPNSQILAFFGGNPNLDPEKGKVATVGFVYDSSFLKGFSVSADYWHYNLGSAITSSTPASIANSCLETGSDQWCSLIHRDPESGDILSMDVVTRNAGFFKTDGVDLSVKYTTPTTSFGKFGAVFDTTWTRSFKYNLGDGDDVEAAKTLDPNYGNFAKWRMNLSLQWAMAGFGVQWNTRYISGTDVVDSVNYDYAGLGLIVHQGGVTYNDLALSYDLKQTGTKFIAGVNNIFDKQPPLAYQMVVNANVDVRTYDVIGRRWFLRVEQSF